MPAFDSGGASGEPPASQEELPSQLDLGSDMEPVASQAESVRTIPDDLLAFADERGSIVEFGAGFDPPSSSPSIPTSEALEARADAVELGEVEGRSDGRASVFRRKWRPNKALQEAMRSAMARAGLAADARQVALVPGANPASSSYEAPQADGPAMKRQRQELVQLTQVKKSALISALPQIVGGFYMSPQLTDAVLAASQLAQLAGERKDEAVFEACRALLTSPSLPLSSKKVRATLLGLSDKHVESISPMIGASVFLMDRWFRAALEKHVASKVADPDLLLYIDFVAYDETPLPVDLRGETGAPAMSESDSATDTTALVSSSSTLCATTPGSVLAKQLSGARGVQKILQTIQQGGMVFKVNGEYVLALMSTLCPLQVLDNGTGAVLHAAQSRCSGATRASSHFVHRLRMACTDRLGSNTLAERLLAEERGATWKRLQTYCEVHMTASAHEKTFALIPGNIQGMIRCALALQTGSAMARFRACLRQEVASRFQVRYGAPPLEAVQYKKRVFQLFVSHGSKLAMRRVLLALCPNGDWRSPYVEYYVPPTSQHTEAELLEHVTSGLIAALCASQPSVYPRRRWTGADLATDTLGVMEACHRLLSTTFLRFAASFETGCRSQQLLDAATKLAQNPLGGASEGIADPQPEAASDPSAGDAGGEVAGDQAAATDEGTQGGETNHAALNAANRRIAANWLLTRPFDRLVLQRLVMEPLRALHRKQFSVASDDWEMAQRAKALRAAKLGKTGFGVRDYRLCLAAKGDDERHFVESLNLLLGPSPLWSLVPINSYTVAFSSLAFRLLSRAGCVIHDLLTHRHQKFPFKMFRLLGEPHLAEEFSQVPPCLMDEWSLDMLASHPTLSGPDFQHKLLLVCLMGWKDISPVEARHATVRRLLNMASLQTRPQVLSDLSANWCALQARRRFQRSSPTLPGQSKKVWQVSRSPPPSRAMLVASCMLGKSCQMYGRLKTTMKRARLL